MVTYGPNETIKGISLVIENCIRKRLVFQTLYLR